MRRKPDPRLHLELGLLKLVTAQRLAPLEEVIAELRGEGTPRSSAAPKSFAAAASATPLPTSTAASASTITPPMAGYSSRPAPAAAPVAPRHSSPFSGTGPTAPPPNTYAPQPALPPRVVANSAEATMSGLAAAQFEAIKAALQGQKFLSSMVDYVSRWELDGSEMRLFFPSDKRALAEMLQGRDAMERLRTVTSQVLGQPLRVCVKLDSASPAGVRGADLKSRFEQDPIVRAMLERFGGRISDVKRRSEE